MQRSLPISYQSEGVLTETISTRAGEKTLEFHDYKPLDDLIPYQVYSCSTIHTTLYSTVKETALAYTVLTERLAAELVGPNGQSGVALNLNGYPILILNFFVNGTNVVISGQINISGTYIAAVNTPMFNYQLANVTVFTPEVD